MSKAPFHPVGHRVLVKMCPVQTMSEGGIIIATDAMAEAEKYATEEATVIEIGPTAYKAFDDGAPWVKVDDKILIKKYAGTNLTDKSSKDLYRMINDDDVVGKLD